MPPTVLDAVGQEIMGTYFQRNTPRRKDEIARSVQEWWSALRTDPLARLSEDMKIATFPSRDGPDIPDAGVSDLSLKAAE